MEQDADTGVSFKDLGIKVVHVAKDSPLGKVRRCRSLSKLEIAFLVISLTSLLSALGITIYRLATVKHASSDFTFGLVILLNIMFCLYYLLSGIFFERPYELGVLVFATGLVLIYLILNYIISVKGIFKLVRLVVAAALSPAVIVMGVLIARKYYISKEFIFRTFGALTELQDICSTMFTFFGLLMADLQMSLSLALLILTSPRYLSLVDIILLALAIIFGISSFFSGYFSIGVVYFAVSRPRFWMLNPLNNQVRWENKYVGIVYGILWFFMPGFALYMIVESAEDLQSPAGETRMEQSLYVMVFVVAGGCLVVRVACAVFGVKVFRNFGKGLKQKVFVVDEQSPKDTNPVNSQAIN